ncbi:MAG TPA: lysophospholipid acyltransferase family protein [Thermoanaerobaculia bacterium]|nr:lysophospholipid acyltransferase family protein [Thermoanaerobaculia bacterium]
MRRLLGPFYVTGVFWFRFHCWGVSSMPEWMVRPSILVFTSFFFLALRNVRKAVAANLAGVLGPCSWWERQRRIWRTLHTFAWCLTERYERLASTRPFTIEVEGMERWREVTATGAGFILLTAHLGSWEAGSMLPADREGRRVNVVRETETDPKAQEFIRDLISRQGKGLYITHFATDDAHLGMQMLEVLRGGEIVALQGDRPRTGGRFLEIPLFDHPFPLPLGPPALARAAGVPMMPVFIFREGRRHYRCLLRPPIHVAETGDRKADLTAAIASFGAELQAAIARSPYQWFCFRQAWLKNTKA